MHTHVKVLACPYVRLAFLILVIAFSIGFLFVVIVTVLRGQLTFTEFMNTIWKLLPIAGGTP